MAKKTRTWRVWADTEKIAKIKRDNLLRQIEEVTGKRPKIPLTKFIDWRMRKEIIFDDNELKNFVPKKRKRRMFSL